MTSFIIIY